MPQQQQSAAPDVKDLATRFADRLWNHPDPGPIDALVTPGFVGHSPGNPDVRGAAELTEAAAELRRALPDLRLRILNRLAEGDRVFLRSVLTGTQQGEYLGIPPAGTPLRITGMTILRFEGGRVAELWQQSDDLGVLDQLGVVPPKEAGPLGRIAHTFRLAARFGVLKAKAAKRERAAAR
ncbi:ester cyclase [Streptomyces sp. CAU 1734]|uniref:ester cyclase n=1 Tax=Streptomyces sp. CAU 1734 TaxID=3140360 RepID=UPI003261819C